MTAPKKPFTEKALKDLYINPEWKCPLCLTPYEKESWAYESIIFDTRGSIEDEDELFIAPFGSNITYDQKEAFNYCKTITMCMTLAGKTLFTRNDMLDAIRTINCRWGKRLCQSRSVSVVKAYDPGCPNWRGTETWTSKEIFCISNELSLPAWGMDIQVAYMPEKAYE